MGSKKVIEIDVIRSGQPRAYADSQYEAIIRFWQEEDGEKRKLFYPKRVRSFGNRSDQDTIDYAKDLFKLHVEDFKEEGDPDRNWASGQLKFARLAQQSDERGIWIEVHMFVIRPFTD